MKKILVLVVFVFTGLLAYSQEVKIPLEELSKLIKKAEKLEIVEKKAKEEKAMWQAEKTALNEDKKVLIEEVRNLKKENIGCSYKVNKLSKQVTALTSEKTSLMRHITELTKDKAVLAKKVWTLRNEQTDSLNQFDKSTEQKETLTIQLNTLKKEKRNLTVKVSTLESKNRKLTDEKVSLKTKVSRLEDEKRLLTTKVRRFTGKKAIIKRASDEKYKLLEKNTKDKMNKIKGQLDISFIPKIKEYIKSTVYREKKTSSYALKCKELTKLLPSKASQLRILSHDLQSYGQLSEIVHQYKDVLKIAYTPQNQTVLSQNYTLPSITTAEQKTDIENHKKAIEDYCKNTRFTANRVKGAKIHVENNPNTMRTNLKEAKKKISPLYTYLRRELDKNIYNLYYNCKIERVDCKK